MATTSPTMMPPSTKTFNTVIRNCGCGQAEEAARAQLLEPYCLGSDNAPTLAEFRAARDAGIAKLGYANASDFMYDAAHGKVQRSGRGTGLDAAVIDCPVLWPCGSVVSNALAYAVAHGLSRWDRENLEEFREIDQEDALRRYLAHHEAVQGAAGNGYRGFGVLFEESGFGRLPKRKREKLTNKMAGAWLGPSAPAVAAANEVLS